MLDELGAVDVGDQDRRHKRLVNLLHEGNGAFALGSDHDAMRLHQVGYGTAFTENFRIGHHVEVCAMAVVPFFRFSDLLWGFYGNGAFVNNHAVIGQNPRDFTSDFLHKAKIDIAIGLLRSRNGDKDDLRILYALLYAPGETQSMR